MLRLVPLGLLALGVLVLFLRLTSGGPAGRTSSYGPARALPASRRTWHPTHRSVAGTTRVEVVLAGDAPGPEGLDRRLVGTVADHDPDYDERFLELMARARERAALLNSVERDGLDDE